MIPRSILPAVEKSLLSYPVTLITGARQVGKTTLCKQIVESHGYNYVTLDNRRDRILAINDPEIFLETNPAPLIIDEIQYAPNLFEVIEEIVNKKKFDTGSNEGMYILTGSQAYNMMQGVTESMAGRVSIIDMSPLSMNEILRREDVPFEVDPKKNIMRSKERNMSIHETYGMIVRGFYPRLYEKADEDCVKFYSNYVDTYIERDVSQIINIKDKEKFHQFLEYVASLTGQELVYEHIANALSISRMTVQSWMSVLISGGIVHLLQPYFDRSIPSRVVKRPKIYFCDTGLACYLTRMYDPETLRIGYLGGHMVETFIINEIMKSYSNNDTKAGFYYYRDSNGKEVDLMIVRNGKISLIELKSGIRYDSKAVKTFGHMPKMMYEIGPSCLICLTESAYPLVDDIYALPITSI